ncbi:MAG: LEA type 2 family protein [Gemmatimonadaceae bacterium]|nr:LEA type 2 family protein [Gemmatimonadaceae bacterium]
MIRRPDRTRRLALFALLSTIVLTGCASAFRRVFDEPYVEFRDVRINGLGLQGGNLDVVLAVYNPNGYTLQGLKLTYNLLVDSTTVGAGTLDGGFTVGAKDTTLVRLPVDFTYRGLGRAGDQLLRTGSVLYRVRGDVTVGTPLGNFSRPYDRTGRFNTANGSVR